MDDLTVIYSILGVSIVGIAGLLVFLRRRWAKWEAVLNQVARELGGRYRKGVNTGFAASPGSVEAKVDGRDVTLETKSTSEGPSGEERETKWMLINISTTCGKPEFFGPATGKRARNEVVDYSRKTGDSATIEISGHRIAASNLPNTLRTALAEDAEARRRLADHFSAGGFLEHGNVVLRTRKFEWDPRRLVHRIREMSEIASMMD